MAGCEGIELAVLPDRLPFARRRLEKWRLTPDATLLRHADLRLASLLTEYADPATDPDRRDALYAEIRARVPQLRRHAPPVSATDPAAEDSPPTETAGDQPPASADTPADSGTEQKNTAD